MWRSVGLAGVCALVFGAAAVQAEDNALKPDNDGYAGRGVEKDQDKSQPVTLKKGVNVLYAAVINGGGPTGLCARFLDKEGNPIKNLEISLTPPAAPAPAAEAAPAKEEK